MSDVEVHAHQATLQLLNEVLTYLRKLPAVPATYHVAKTIEAHLLDARNAKVMTADLREEIRASCYSPAGIELLRAVLKGDELNLIVPEQAKNATGPHHLDPGVMSTLLSDGGLTLNLRG